MNKNILTSKVTPDEFTAYASKAFDYEFDGVSVFEGWEMPNLPKDFSIGLIVGASGSGKSTLLKQFGKEESPSWDKDKAIVSHFKTPEIAIDTLSSVGLNSVPSWMKPFHVLSTGEQFRAQLARNIKSNSVIDEFTSVVNREVAKSASLSISKYIKREGFKNVVFASCHEDIKDWLMPDWIFNTQSGELTIGRWLRQPQIKLRVYRCAKREWEGFKNHHYLSKDMNSACRCFIGMMNDTKVAFNASMCLPGRVPPLYNGDERVKFRESRTVVLPDYQGIGLGVRFSDAIADIFLDDGYRYFSKTAHIRMGEYRQKADFWRPTSTNLVSRSKSREHSLTNKWKHLKLDTKRLCYSHEYIGKQGNKHRELYNKHINTN